MITEDRTGTECSQIPDSFFDCWALVLLDVFEKLKDRGELPDDDPPGDSQCPSTSPAKPI